MRKTLIINRERSRNDVIYDIVGTAKEHGYKKDTMYRRMCGVKDLEENQFNFMVRKIVRDELEIREIIFCGSEKFREDIEKEIKT